MAKKIIRVNVVTYYAIDERDMFDVYETNDIKEAMIIDAEKFEQYPEDLVEIMQFWNTVEVTEAPQHDIDTFDLEPLFRD